MNTLGIRNNNPFNIRYNKSNMWRGLTGQNKGFCTFENIEFGLRAGLITLRTYMRNHGLCTVYSIINRFAPPLENNTVSYVSSVCSNSGIEPFTYLQYGDDNFIRVVIAMLRIESNYKSSFEEIKNIMVKFKLL